MNKQKTKVIVIFFISCVSIIAPAKNLVPVEWDAQKQADQVMEGLKNVCGAEVKGAHDSDFIIKNNKAYIAYMANDKQPGENPAWDFVYVALSIVNPSNGKVEQIIPVAKAGQKFSNETLPQGAVFVPRLILKNERTLRCFLAVEKPGGFEARTWALDFDMQTQKFSNSILKARLKTSAGIEDMQPGVFYQDAVKYGFRGERKNYGLYPFDINRFNNRYYIALNNYPGGQNALAVLNDDLLTFEILGHYNKPDSMKLTESAVCLLPDKTWLAICRQEGGTRNYAFTGSRDGRNWSTAEYRDFVKNGTSSKPTFDLFGDIYYLGWQEQQPEGAAHRSVFNIDVSVDGKSWERKYHFVTDKSFQYPKFFKYNGTIYLTVTQGDYSGSRKERIMFGKLE